MPSRIAKSRRFLLVGSAGVVALLAFVNADRPGRKVDGPAQPPPSRVATADPEPAPVPAATAAVSAPQPLPLPSDPLAPDPGPERLVLDRPITDLDPETRALLEARLEREREADRRFEAGLEASQVRARDIDARVQAAFERVELSPDLLDGGTMRGLRVRSVHGGSPLSEAGFRAGDLLVRLDGRALDDPATLPDVLASAGPELSLCAQRGETEFCRDLVLR